nr:hypothetical protein BaRGS_004673 [Batillaria attramentaria]
MAGGKPDQSSLLARQPFGGPVLNNLDKVHHGKTLNVHSLPQGSGSASAVVMREKVSSASNLRASSLVTPSRRHTDVSGDGLSRHASRSMDMGSLRWKCRACTMENSSANTICVACSKSRDAPDLQTPAGESKRVCPHCTLENAPGLVECDACGNLLPQEVHTFV